MLLQPLDEQLMTSFREGNERPRAFRKPHSSQTDQSLRRVMLADGLQTALPWYLLHCHVRY